VAGSQNPKDKRPEAAAPEGAADSSSETNAERGGIPADQLLLAVESELIPRLMLSARLAKPTDNDRFLAVGGSSQDLALSNSYRADIAKLVELARRNDGRGMDRVVDAALERGVDITRIFLDLLAPAAHQLGDGWLADRISFVDVHIGLLALRELVGRYEVSTPRVRVAKRSILLASAPGDQHTFGITLVSDCFQRSGWHVRNGCGSSIKELVKLVAENSYTCVGLSLYCDTQVDSLQSCIEDIRAASLNPDLIVLIGGSSFVGMAEPAERVGADLYLESAELAVSAVSVLLGAPTLALSRSNNVSLAEG
jgi:methanogenic corrinoid protein MtbC1